MVEIIKQITQRGIHCEYVKDYIVYVDFHWLPFYLFIGFGMGKHRGIAIEIRTPKHHAYFEIKMRKEEI